MEKGGTQIILLNTTNGDMMMRFMEYAIIIK